MINKEFHKSKVQMKSEQEDIEAAKNDIRNFELLYNRYHEQIFRYLYARVDNQHLAADLCSQVFYKAMLNIENYSFKGVPFSSWLYRIAFNEMNMHFRRSSKDRTINIESTNVYELEDEIEEEETEENKEQLLKALRSWGGSQNKLDFCQLSPETILESFDENLAEMNQSHPLQLNLSLYYSVIDL